MKHGFISVPILYTYITVPPKHLQIFHSRNLNTLGTGYCVGRSWGRLDLLAAKYWPPDPMPPEAFLGTASDASGAGERRRHGYVGRARPCTGHGCCRREGGRIVLRHSHEWLGEKKGSSPYRNVPKRKTLSPDIFAYDSSPTSLQAPLRGPFGTKLSPADPAASAHDTSC